MNFFYHRFLLASFSDISLYSRYLTFFFFLLASSAQAQEFKNPLLPSGADPYSFYHNGFYYYTHTTGRNLAIWKTADMSQLSSAQRKVVWTPPKGAAYAKEIWAPEIMRIDGKWYFYFAADDGNNNNHRMYVLENRAEDPMEGDWVFKGKVNDPSDKWAIDGDVFKHKGQLYMIWSGWEGDKNGQQNIYIARMKNPWTIEGERVLISAPELDWEIHGDLGAASDPPHVSVNEGPQYLAHKGNVFIVYSASGCWTDYYALGLLSAKKNGDLMDPKTWRKSPEPVFKQAPELGVYAPGHNSFFKSPDGKTDYILYHANDQPGQGCGRFRTPRAQAFSWGKDGKPVFGKPVKTSD